MTEHIELQGYDVCPICHALPSIGFTSTGLVELECHRLLADGDSLITAVKHWKILVKFFNRSDYWKRD